MIVYWNHTWEREAEICAYENTISRTWKEAQDI